MENRLIDVLSQESARKLRLAVAAMPCTGDLCLSHRIGAFGTQLSVEDLVDFLDQYGAIVKGVSQALDAAKAELAQYDRDVVGLRRLFGASPARPTVSPSATIRA